MKKHDDFMKFDIPEIQQEDILQTIQRSKAIVKEAPLAKMETSKAKQMLQILRHHFPRLLLVEGGLCLFLLTLLIILTKSEFGESAGSTNNITTLCLYTIYIGSSIFSVTTCLELIRNHMSDVWEIEKACTVRLEKIILYKLLLLTIVSFMGIAVLSCMLSVLQKELSGITLFFFGILPYLCITTCLVQFQEKINTVQRLFTGYVFMSVFYIGCIQLSLINIATLNPMALMVLLVVILVICFSLNVHKLNKQ